MQLTISRSERDYQPEWHEPDNVLMQGVRSIYNRIPVNARAVMEYGLGRTSPFTEKDFSPVQLQAIRDQYVQHMAQNADNYALARSAQDRLTPENALQMDPLAAASGASAEEVYARLKDKYARQVEAYESQMAEGRTPVAKYDSAGHIDEQGWGNVLSGLSDPNMQIGTTLGRYNVLNSPHGPMVYDRYDFNHYGTEGQEPFSWDMLAHPVKGLDWAMRKYGPEYGVPVQIMLRSQK